MDFPTFPNPLFSAFSRNVANDGAATTTAINNEIGGGTAATLVGAGYTQVPRPEVVIDRGNGNGLVFTTPPIVHFNSLAVILIGKNRGSVMADDTSSRGIVCVSGGVFLFTAPANSDSVADELGYPLHPTSGICPPSSRSVIIISLNPTGSIIACNGRIKEYTEGGWGDAALGVNGLFGAGLNVGGFMSIWNEVRLFDYGMSRPDVLNVFDYAEKHSEYPVNVYSSEFIVCDGDSMTYGLGVAAVNCWPIVLSNKRTQSEIFNFGKPNRCISDFGGAGTGIRNNVANIIKVFKSGARNYYILTAGTNDVSVGKTVAQVQADIIAVIAIVQAAGGIVFVAEIPNRNMGGSQASYDAVKIAINAWLHSTRAALGIAGIIRTSTDPILGNLNLSTIDGTHWNKLGNLRYAELVDAALNSANPYLYETLELVSGTVADLSVASGQAAESLDAIQAKTSLIQSDIGTPPPTFAVIGDAQSALTSISFHRDFFGQGLDSTGWTRFVFTLKADKETQGDSEALLTVRVSNPPDASDGVLVWKGQPVATGAPMQTAGSLLVTLIGADTNVAADFSADAMDLDPSPLNAPYTYEIDRWIGSVKIPVGIGDFNLTRSVRRRTVSP